MKKIMLLGGSRYIVPVIEAAHKQGCHVVTVDYLPDNIAHKFSDEYHNVSITDKDAVLNLARSLNINGIMSFAADPGVLSAAYVAEEIGLPFQGPYQSIAILQDKKLFRAFLQKNGFNCPEFHVFSSVEDVRDAACHIKYPVIVKPVDSAGSKGCERVDIPENLPKAAENALGFSAVGDCIVEQFLEKQNCSSDADAFLAEGDFKCISYTAQLFDNESANPYTPAAYLMPAEMPDWAQEELNEELQRLANLLELNGSGVFNIETRLCTNGKPYIMEMAPRGGGNRLCEMLNFASGIDLVTASIMAALGESVSDVRSPEYNGVWYQQMLHVNNAGIFDGVEFISKFKEDHVMDEQIWVNKGDRVEAFASANFAIGSVMMRFDNREQADYCLANLDDFMKVKLK